MFLLDRLERRAMHRTQMRVGNAPRAHDGLKRHLLYNLTGNENE
jgi:hypothetical protein